MKILITGATGLLGRLVTKELLVLGYELVVMTRNKKKAKKKLPFPIEFCSPLESKNSLPANIQGVVHLMGENIGEKRWSKKQKQKIYDSRVVGTQKLVQKLASQKLEFFISASAVGYYPSSDKEQTEASASGEGFLSGLCRDWETEAKRVNAKRIVLFRLGLILSSEGGALAKMLKIFRLGLGGKIGSAGYLSWIEQGDAVAAIVQAVEKKTYQGIYNLTTPYPVHNSDFTKILAKILGMPAFFPVPKFLLKLVMGERACLVLANQKVLPQRLQKQKFSFSYPKIEDALKQSCHLMPTKNNQPKSHQLVQYFQTVPAPIGDVFPFFSNPKNLGRITPDFLHFKILSSSDKKVQKNTVIEYSIRLHQIPMKWKTLILELQENQYFIDKQIQGPYLSWIHQHFFYPIQKGGTKGVLLEDRVFYRLPLEPLSFLALPLVKKDIQNIFAFRQQSIQKIFQAHLE